MVFHKFVANQAKHPAGIFSIFAVRSMNRLNVNINRTTIQLLGIEPTDRILEIGFGGGIALNEMTNLVEGGLIAGIETSDAMLKRCTRRFSKFISQGKMELKKGNSSEIPYNDSSFDKAFAINCMYFWSNPATDLKEIRRVLKQNGVLIISGYAKEEFEKWPPTQYGFKLYLDDQIKNLLSNAGFTRVRIERRTGQPYTATYAIGTNP